MKLDHVMYAVSDLQDGISEVEKLTGVKATFGGSHEGQGTCNALLSFANSQYLEIIAPDKEQELAETTGQELLDRQFSGIRRWAVATDSFDTVKPVLDEYSYGYHIIDMTRTRPDGLKLAWQILFVRDHPFRDFMPFFINWLDSPHPADDSPAGCTLNNYAVQLVNDSEVFSALMKSLDIDVEVIEGPDGMRAIIDSPNGRVMLH
ncbi:MAG: VOC family protein [Pseudomonadales bacterium]|jgi:hypothetical protein